MRYSIATLALLLSLSLSVCAEGVISKVSRGDVITILHNEGYFAEPIKDSDTKISLAFDGVKGTLFCIDSGTTLQAWAYWGNESGEVDSASLAKVNSWNTDKRFSRAYLDSDGDYNLELDYDLTGGVTKSSIIAFIAMVKQSFTAFNNY